MDQILNFLSNPIVGSVIGILGIVIGAVLAILFYFKAKYTSKPCYSIANTSLIDLSVGEIPPSVTMRYDGEEIPRLNKTTIKFWNNGKKPIMDSDLSPEYIEIPFGDNCNDEFQILNVNMTKNRSQTVLNGPTIHEKVSVRFGFNFLEQGDQICITVLHTSDTVPSHINGHVVGVPNGFINMSKQTEMTKTISEILLGGYSGILAEIVRVMIKMLTKMIK